MTRKWLISLALVLLPLSSAFAGWTSLNPPTASDLNAITLTSPGSGWAVGAAGTVVKIISGGASLEVSTQGSSNFNDVVFPATLEGYLLGDASLYQTTDGGASFESIIPADLAGANFRKGSFNDTNRVFAVYTREADASYLYSSTDGGTTFLKSPTLEGFEIIGAAVTGNANFEWGWDGTSFIIVKNGVLADRKWTGTAAQSISDIFFASDSIGYAVGKNGDGGLVLKTVNGGNGWTEISNPASQNLNGVSFLPGYTSTGWMVGEGKTIIITNDSGGSFIAYQDASLEDSLHDIASDLEVDPDGHIIASVYAVGEKGKMFKLPSPTITAVTPNSRMQGWVGSVTIEGTNFMPGPNISVLFSPALYVFSKTAESETKIRSVVLVQPDAAPGPRDLTVENPDNTLSIEASAFTVEANTGQVTVDNVWFNGRKYQTLEGYTILQTPTISFEVRSSSANITKETLNGKIILLKGGFYENVYDIPESAVTLVGTNDAIVTYALTPALPSGIATLEIYAEDSAANVGRVPLLVEVAVDSDKSPPPGDVPVSDYAKVVAPIWNLAVAAQINLQVQITHGYSFPEGFDLIICDPNVVLYTFTYDKDVAGTVNIVVEANKLAEQYLHNGMWLVVIVDRATGNRFTSPLVINTQ
jgi:photosystem II stability/assembly factor-like uncharacterized protein